MGNARWMLVAAVCGALVAGPVGTAGAAKGGRPSSDDPASEPTYLTSLCDGPRLDDSYLVNGAVVPADLACDAEHGLTAPIAGLVWPTFVSDCAGRGAWSPGNSHPCPSGSVGLAGVAALPGYPTFGYDETADTVIGFDADVIRFRNAAGGVVLASGRHASHLRLYLHAYPDGTKYTTDPDDPALALGCDLPADVDVTLRLRRDAVALYPGKGDRADTRRGPAAYTSVGDVVLVQAGDPDAPTVVLDAAIPGACAVVP